ncbi:MAG: outer membrane beta-barrel protein [Bacteroidales bacterium]|jgi:hypothetical protein|nr:outer membrane beta-barrel protein [Bacteroidales bacterium]
MSKIKHFFLISILLSTIIVAAQPKAEIQRWYISVFGGANISDLSSSNYDLRFNNETALLAGISLQYVLNEHISFKSGLEYDERKFGMEAHYQGLRLADTSTYVCYSCRYDYIHQISGYYLTFPLVFQYSKNSKRFGLHIKGGLYYSLLLSAYEDGSEVEYLDPVQAAPFADYNIYPGLYVNIFKGTTDKLLNTYDAGVILGLGATYALNNSLALLAEANLQVGFQPIFESPEMIAIYHKAFQLRGGIVYRLNFGGS